MKKCSACGHEKDRKDFHVRKASPDGLAYKCRDCVNQFSSAWRKENPGAHKDWYSKNKQRRSDYNRVWRAENVDYRKVIMREWLALNGERVREKNSRRRAKKVSACPKWADREAMRRVYAEAARLTRETGIRHEVDHVVPLQGDIVSGLHCEANLQILTKFENISKLNRYWPDMP